MADKKLQLKRNQTNFSSKETALNSLKTQLTSANAGEPVLAIYSADEKEYILLGIKGNNGYQIFEGATLNADGKVEVPESVQDAIDEALENLQGETEWESFDDIKDAIDEIAGKIEALDVVDEADDTKYVSAVSQEDGKITITRQNLLSSENNNVLELKNGSLYLNGDFDFGTY